MHKTGEGRIKMLIKRRILRTREAGWPICSAALPPITRFAPDWRRLASGGVLL